MARQPETVQVVLDELREAGLEAIMATHRGHAKIRFYVAGRKYTYVVPKTTGDGGRAVKNCRAGIRRLVREALTSA